jgi:hypothetical protein
MQVVAVAAQLSFLLVQEVLVVVETEVIQLLGLTAQQTQAVVVGVEDLVGLILWAAVAAQES